MPNQDSNSGTRQLDSIERSSEVVFGLIMVLTFTGSFRITGGDYDSVDRMLLAALGRNLAWGIIDAVMYLMAIFSQRSHNLLLLRQVRAVGPEEGRPPHRRCDVIASSQRNNGHGSRSHSPPFHAITCAHPARPTAFSRLPCRRRSLSVGVSLDVPWGYSPWYSFASRASRRGSLTWLPSSCCFVTGYAYGRYVGYRPLRVGFWMVLVGAGMVVLTVALGG